MTPPTIDPQLTVEHVVRRFPAAAAVFARRGMSCVGCEMAPFETLAEVAAVYRQDLPAFLADLVGPSAPSPGGECPAARGERQRRPNSPKAR